MTGPQWPQQVMRLTAGDSPFLQGESRGANLRVMFEGPLGTDYAVFAYDRIVQVLTVWRVNETR
jgi:hypothetical protein